MIFGQNVKKVLILLFMYICLKVFTMTIQNQFIKTNDLLTYLQNILLLFGLAVVCNIPNNARQSGSFNHCDINMDFMMHWLLYNVMRLTNQWDSFHSPHSPAAYKMLTKSKTSKQTCTKCQKYTDRLHH